MFRKLKMQFILTNLSIITVIFFSLTVGVYIVMRVNMVQHIELFSKMIANEFESGIFPETPGAPFNHLHRLKRYPNGVMVMLPLQPLNTKFRTPGPNSFVPPDIPYLNSPLHRGNNLPLFFFVKTNGKGEFSSNTPFRDKLQKQLALLIGEAIKTKSNSKIVHKDGMNYYCYISPLHKQTGELFIFHNVDMEIHLESILVKTLIVTGLVFLFLALIGSTIMAQKAVKPINLAWKQQEEFLADASHELRTPLSIIQTNLDVIRSEPDSTVASQFVWLSNINDEVKQMTDLVSSLLLSARLESNSFVAKLSEFYLDKVVVHVMEAFSPLAAAKDIQLTYSFHEKVLFVGDEANIRRVLEIILDNAIRHTDTRGEINLDLRIVNRKIVIQIADTGEGIAPECIGKIFERFYQSDSSRSKGKAGLGLSIAKAIIEKNGGTIGVSSELGKGTTFKIELPLAKN